MRPLPDLAKLNADIDELAKIRPKEPDLRVRVDLLRDLVNAAEELQRARAILPDVPTLALGGGTGNLDTPIDQALSNLVELFGAEAAAHDLTKRSLAALEADLAAFRRILGSVRP